MKIRTSGELREFLLETMVKVREGGVKPHEASVITKLAQQTNESLYAELKARKIEMESGIKSSKAVGEMSLGS